MLSASAYSFRQKSRLAISLSWVAGYTNVILVILCGVVVAHTPQLAPRRAISPNANTSRLRNPGSMGPTRSECMIVKPSSTNSARAPCRLPGDGDLA